MTANFCSVWFLGKCAPIVFPGGGKNPVSIFATTPPSRSWPAVRATQEPTPLQELTFTHSAPSFQKTPQGQVSC